MAGRVAPRAPNGFWVPVGRGVPAEPLTGSPHRLLAQPEASPYPMAFERSGAHGVTRPTCNRAFIEAIEGT